MVEPGPSCGDCGDSDDGFVTWIETEEVGGVLRWIAVILTMLYVFNVVVWSVAIWAVFFSRG